MTPPPYPRIPHLFRQPGTERDDRVMPEREARATLAGELLIEEKLDGFNISVASDPAGWPVPYARSGKSSGDRGGQLGRVRAFLTDRADSVRGLLERWPVLYAEWLMRRHTVAYDALPSWLIVLDLWSPSEGFASTAERDAQCASAGLSTPPALYVGTPRTVATLAGLCARSRYGSGPAEGVVLRDARPVSAAPVAKWLAPSFRRRTDDEFAGAEMNRLAAAVT